MFSFDLSTTNILLIAAAVALFVLFITVLMKLNPSTETKETLKRDIPLERKKTLPTEKKVPLNILAAKESVPATVGEKPLVTLNKTLGAPSIPTNQENETPILSQSTQGMPKPEKIVAQKVETNNSSHRDCLHQFGYLRTLPKNAPIPDECLGCQKVVECLVKAKTQ